MKTGPPAHPKLCFLEGPGTVAAKPTLSVSRFGFFLHLLVYFPLFSLFVGLQVEDWWRQLDAAVRAMVADASASLAQVVSSSIVISPPACRRYRWKAAFAACPLLLCCPVITSLREGPSAGRQLWALQRHGILEWALVLATVYCSRLQCNAHVFTPATPGGSLKHHEIVSDLLR